MWDKNSAPPGGLEPPTFRLTAERASRLRHGGMVLVVDGRPVLEYMLIWRVERPICSVLKLPCTSVRYGLVVRISGSHPGGPGSIPGNGNHLFLFPFDRVRVLLTTGLPKGGGEGTRLTKLQSATGWPRMKRAPHSKRKVEAASTRKNCKNFDEDGIRTHAGRAHWISSPTP